MPKKRPGVPPLRPLCKNRKPTTALQQAFLDHQDHSIQHAESSTPIIRNFLMQDGHRDRLAFGYSNQNQDYADHDNESEGPDEAVDAIVCSNEWANPELDPLLDAMAEARYQACRLEKQERWSLQYDQMLPALLRNRLRTSNWAHDQLWDHDFKSPCDCVKTTRPVDLVDMHVRKQIKVEFCNCCSDLVRLVEMGYIGTSPVHPRTAFSIRLLHTHHVFWKHCTIPTQAFAAAIDELLDDANPLILINGTGRPRSWRVPLTYAIDAYRALLNKIRQLEFDKLKLNALGQLAANCPRCFGPPVGVTNEHEPDVVVTEDGNFQHKRHVAASVPIPGYEPPVPEVFVPSREVRDMADELTRLSSTGNRDLEGNNHLSHEVHPCTEAHTAADDVRGKSSFQGFQQCGLFVMGCRHDHALRFIDIVQSGEKAYFALTMMRWIFGVLSLRNHTNKVGFLYDIGCNMEKGIIKRDQFSAERAMGRLKIATSVFHAYAHDWGCQLDYNPRLNKGWGLSDGEGSERIWFDLSPLVGLNRHSTNEHRLENINLRTIHRNEILRTEAVSSMVTWGAEVQRRLHEAEACLIRLQGVNDMYTPAYFESQWERQKRLQKASISESIKQRRERLSILLALEENLYEARLELEELNAKRARTRTAADQRGLLGLPKTLTTLEKKMDELANELGSSEFLHLADTIDPRTKPLIIIQLAKSELYNAKMGVIQHLDIAHLRTGTKDQPKIKARGQKKDQQLKRKHNTYHRHVSTYNHLHHPSEPIADPTLEEVQAMPITDFFWDISGLTHPNEAWATDVNVKTGIQAFLCKRGAVEEMFRIGREVRQLLLWALEYQGRVNSMRTNEANEEVGNVPELEGLHAALIKRACRLWMRWDPQLAEVVRFTSPYMPNSSELDTDLKTQWSVMIESCQDEWANLVGKGVQSAEDVEEDER